MSGKPRDYFTNFKAAGHHISQFGDGTASCLLPQASTTTPPHITKYRASYRKQHGVPILHPGLVDAPKQPANYVYGKRNPQNAPVAALIQTKNKGINELINSLEENKYASTQKQPLAQAPTRNYVWPEQARSSDFRFGQKIPPQEYTAKDLLLPHDSLRDTEDIKYLYKRSHGNFDPGEQIQRNYNWNINPETHRFGKVDKVELNQMNRIIHSEQTKNEFPKTLIIKKNQNDWKDYSQDPVGYPKNFAQVNSNISQSCVFGLKKQMDEWSVGDCIKGQASWKEVTPDHNLGKATRYSYIINQYQKDMAIGTSRNQEMDREFLGFRQFEQISQDKMENLLRILKITVMRSQPYLFCYRRNFLIQDQMKPISVNQDRNKKQQIQ